jgi:hypothetical protein
MDNIIINPTNDSPHVVCDVQGEFLMTGRSLPENPAKFFDPIFLWIKSYTGEKIHIKFKLEYFNTASSKQIFNLIRAFVDNQNVKDIKVEWHYEEGDSDSLETGQHYSQLFKLPFEFIEYAESGF